MKKDLESDGRLGDKPFLQLLTCKFTSLNQDWSITSGWGVEVDAMGALRAVDEFGELRFRMRGGRGREDSSVSPRILDTICENDV